jgi:hypothetical protein
VVILNFFFKLIQMWELFLRDSVLLQMWELFYLFWIKEFFFRHNLENIR